MYSKSYQLFRAKNYIAGAVRKAVTVLLTFRRSCIASLHGEYTSLRFGTILVVSITYLSSLQRSFTVVGYKILSLQQFVSLWYKCSKCNEYVRDIIHGIPIEMYVFCNVTLLHFLSLLCTLLSMVLSIIGRR